MTTPLLGARRAALAFFLLLLASLLSGCLGCGGEPQGSGTDALLRSFPDQAAQVLDGRAALALGDDAFAIDPESAALGPSGLVARLPLRAQDPVRFQLAQGVEIKVREVGLAGLGAPAGRAVTYAREGGASYWTATPGGYEEWLHLEPGRAARDRVAAVWEIEGATPRQRGAAIDLVGARGSVLLTVTAPRAYAAGGKSVEATLAAAGAAIELRVDAGNEEVLVDPLWTLTGSMAAARAFTAGSALQNGKVLVAGGYNAAWLATAELYDPASGLWSSTSPLQNARAGHSVTTLNSGKALAVGGYNNGTYEPAELFDPGNGTWSPAGVMITPRSLHTATVLPNGKVLVAGGSTGGAISVCEIYMSAPRFT